MFGNYAIETEERGIAKLRYDLCLDQEGLYLNYTPYGWSALNAFFRDNPNVRIIEGFQTPEKESWGIEQVFETLPTDKGFIVRIPSHDKKKMVNAAKSLAMLTYYEAFLTDESTKRDVKKDALRDRQLFSFDTGFSEDGRPHGWSMSLSISPPIGTLLEEIGPVLIPKASEEMQRQWFTVDPKPKRDRVALEDSFAGAIRESGVPRFQTIGSCACMSTNPDEKDEGGGFTIFSHNVDACIQQVNLLIGIACLWSFSKTELLKRA